jgi:RHS repeat-associated protein
MTKSYFLGGMRVASRSTNDVGWQFAAQTGSPIRVASAWVGRPALVLFLRSDIQLALGTSIALLTAALLVAPWRRKRVVGIAVRHGHVIGIVIVFFVGTLPVPLIVQPASAQSATTTPGCTGCDCPTPTPVPFVEEVRHYHFDHLGSTQVITDEDGNVVEQIRYMPYGAIRGRWDGNGTLITNADENHRYEFTGYETEVLSGLQYAGARFYDPELSSFLTHDPARQFASPYTYTNWNPVNLVDPDGRDAGVLIVIGLILVALQAVASAIDTGIRTGDADAAIGAFGQGLTIGLTTAGFGFGVAQFIPTAVNIAFALSGLALALFLLWFRRHQRYTGQTFLLFLAMDGARKLGLELLRFETVAHLQWAALGAALVGGIGLAANAFRRLQPPLPAESSSLGVAKPR